MLEAESLARYAVTPQPVTIEFRELVRRELPAIDDDPAHWRMLEYLLFGAFYGNETRQLLLSQGLLARIAGEDALRAHSGKKFVAWEFLESFRDAVLPHFTWSGFHSDGYAREVESLGLPESVQCGLDQETRYIDGLEPCPFMLVYFSTGIIANAANRRKQRTELERLAELLQQDAMSQEAREIAEYLNRLPPNPFTAATKKYLPAARLAVDSIVKYENGRRSPKKTQKSKDMNRAILRAIDVQPKPFYQPSRAQRTVRLFPLAASMLMLSREVRGVLTKDWISYDLRSSQLAIVARLWNIPLATDFLEQQGANGPTVWQSLFKHYGLPVNDDIKKIFKEALYSLIFGKNVPHVKGTITRKMRQLGIDGNGNTFFTHGVIQAVLNARTKRVRAVLASGYLINIFGNKQDVEEIEEVQEDGKVKVVSNVNSLLALEAQEVELHLMYPLFDVARKYEKEFRIVLFQHDGISVRYSNTTKVHRYEKRLVQAVQERADKLGISTSLVGS